MSGTGFDDVNFPLALGFGASGGPVWQTEIVQLASGHEVRNARWARPRRRWDAASAMVSAADIATVTDFFNARRGRLGSFRFRDPGDHSSAGAGEDPAPQDQLIGVGDGVATTFQLTRSYGVEVRAISKPVDDTVRIGLDGVELLSGWQVDVMTGVITFDAPPGAGVAVTAGYLFDCEARFDTDALDFSFDTLGAGRVISLPIVEVVRGAGV